MNYLSYILTLKSCMLKKPILVFPDYTKPFHIQSDASKFGAGGILYQFDKENRQRIVSSRVGYLIELKEGIILLRENF